MSKVINMSQEMNYIYPFEHFTATVNHVNFKDLVNLMKNQSRGSSHFKWTDSMSMEREVYEYNFFVKYSDNEFYDIYIYRHSGIWRARDWNLLKQIDFKRVNCAHNIECPGSKMSCQRLSKFIVPCSQVRMGCQCL